MAVAGNVAALNLIQSLISSGQGVWGEWSTWKSERTCLLEPCVGESTRTREDFPGSVAGGAEAAVSPGGGCDPMNKGILITSYNQADIFIPSTKEIHSLPAIPGSPRVWHTQVDNIICGGVYPSTSNTCLKLSETGQGWQEYKTLNKPRQAHSSWKSPDGIVLMGGFFSGKSTEIVGSSGSRSRFSLQDNTTNACAISDEDEVVITGGFGNRKSVKVYNLLGFNRNLPDLNFGRQYHACASYQDNNNRKTFLVAGGFTGIENTKSTEILTDGANIWTIVGELPRARHGLRATNVNNIIYVLGGDSEILKFDSLGKTWTVFFEINSRDGNKLEVSTVDCTVVESYASVLLQSPWAGIAAGAVHGSITGIGSLFGR